MADTPFTRGKPRLPTFPLPPPLRTAAQTLLFVHLGAQRSVGSGRTRHRPHPGQAAALTFTPAPSQRPLPPAPSPEPRTASRGPLPPPPNARGKTAAGATAARPRVSRLPTTLWAPESTGPGPGSSGRPLTIREGIHFPPAAAPFSRRAQASYSKS